MVHVLELLAISAATLSSVVAKQNPFTEPKASTSKYPVRFIGG